MAKRQAPEPQSTGSFEESLQELQSIVADLEDGALGLEASLQRFEKGIGLLRTCYAILESAEAKVEVLTRFNGDGPPELVPFTTEASFSAPVPTSPKVATAQSSASAGAIPEPAPKAAGPCLPFES